MQPRKSGRRLPLCADLAHERPDPTKLWVPAPLISHTSGLLGPCPPGLALLRLPPAKGGDSSYGAKVLGFPSPRTRPRLSVRAGPRRGLQGRAEDEHSQAHGNGPPSGLAPGALSRLLQLQGEGGGWPRWG